MDGCKAGWFYFRLGPQSGDPPYGVVKRLEQIVQRAGNEDLILVDIPIGLPERVGQDGREREAAFRTCDRKAHEKLGNRKSSVFQVPVRPVMEALRDAMKLGVPPKDEEEKKRRHLGGVPSRSQKGHLQSV